MGSAIAQGIVKNGLFEPEEVMVCDLIPEKAEVLARELNVKTSPTAPEVAGSTPILLIAVKPQVMEICLAELKSSIRQTHLIISIAAGITTHFIESRLGNDTRVVRVMPNTPALVGAGASAICSGTHATEEDLDQTEKIFAALGTVYRFDESLMDAVTAVSGSGPAYLFLFAECLERAAIEIGLPEDKAADLAAQTLYGASKLLTESGQTAEELRAKVTSPGGTTEAAIAMLNERGFEASIAAAVNSALARARELGGAKN